MPTYKIWSCKHSQPHTLKSHRTIESAMKKVGDYGFVYDPESQKVYQVFEMSNGTIQGFDIVAEPEKCTLGDFDMIATLDSWQIPRPGGLDFNPNEIPTLSVCKELISGMGHFGTGDILFHGKRLGNFVTHGHGSGNGATVYASRLVKPAMINVTASRRETMLNKVAKEISIIPKRDNLSIGDIESMCS